MTEFAIPGSGVFILTHIVDDHGNQIRVIDLSKSAFMARYHWFQFRYD